MEEPMHRDQPEKNESLASRLSGSIKVTGTDMYGMVKVYGIEFNVPLVTV